MPRSKLHEALGHSLHAWATVEMALADILAYLLNPKTAETFSPTEDAVGHMIFYTVTSTEARMQVVDSVVRYCMVKPGGGYDGMLEIWQKLLEKSGELKDVRNNIAHGSETIQHGDVLRWWFQIGDQIRQNRDRRRRDRSGRGHRQPFGMSINDIKQAIENFYRHSEFLRRFRDLIIRSDRLHSVSRHLSRKDWMTWHSALRQLVFLLASDLKIVPPRTNALNWTTRLERRLSSRR